MVLRTDDSLSMSAVGMILHLMLAAYCAIYAGFEGDWWFKLIILLMILNELLTMICFARTITLSEDGCEIRIWKFRKFYTWNEMWYRQWRNCTENRDVYPGGIWFNAKQVDHSWMGPEILRGQSYLQNGFV